MNGIYEFMLEYGSFEVGKQEGVLSMTAAARKVISGKSSLRSHLRSILPSIRRHPCLFVSSSPPPPEPGVAPQKVDQALKSFTNDVDTYVMGATSVTR